MYCMIKMAMGLALALAFLVGPGEFNTIQGAGKPPQVHLPNSSGAHLTGVHNDVEIQTVDDVVVRRMKPKEEFDENGKPRKLTAAEEREQKGQDPNLPGYNADV